MSLVTAQVIAVVFFATFIRSALGFGEALVAVPLLALFIPLSVAAPLAVLVSITIAAVVVAQDFRAVELRSAGWLVFSTLFGIPLGLLLLTSSHHEAVRIALAIVIIAFAAYSLAGRKPPALERESKPWLLGCGFVAGIFGGAYGMNGPPLAIYGAMRRWPAQRFRATLQGYFLPASILGMFGYWLAGLWTPAVTHDFLVCLPALLPAILLGRLVNHRLEPAIFQRVVYLGLAGIGLLLLAQSLGALK